jgi:hypothetical protein
MDWMGLKGLASDLSVEKDAMHVYAAFLIQIGAAALLRTSVARWAPWLIVLAIELANESMDMWFGEEAHIQPWQLYGARHDLINTMILPTLLLVTARYTPWLFRRDARPKLPAE